MNIIPNNKTHTFKSVCFIVLLFITSTSLNVK
ncbi:hypothetical protein DX932_04580 [Bacillus cereus]|uniref:Uncharacterized protein n=1 Tax=Bacillus cereus TaxID=1396 RepID=A0A9W7QA14_BACCE|nr:hypothetical protein DX932_04580 [Bacillus cereus]KAB2502894.1 hypothetical protein F8156_18715 [Bacillus cereus]HEF5706555.1 hypothetical protein [Bacillus cereus]